MKEALKSEDLNKLVAILAGAAASSFGNPEAYLKDLVESADLPEAFYMEVCGQLGGAPDSVARKLIHWATHKGETTLGCLLEVLLPKLGEEDFFAVSTIIFCYSLYRDPHCINRLAQERIENLAKLGRILGSKEWFLEFVDILKSINDFSLFEKALSGVKSGILLNFKRIDRDAIENPDCYREVKIFWILWLLFEYPQLEGYPSILWFARYLKPEISVEAAAKLTEWISEVEDLTNCDLPSRFSRSHRDAAAPTLNACLMLVVSKYVKDEFRLNAFLEDEDNILMEDIVESIQHKPEKGIVCKHINDIKKRALQCIQKSRERLQTEKRVRSYGTYQLTIELFLDYQHLCEAVDLWEIEEEPIGICHRLAVRSYDRVRNPEYQNRLDTTWQKLQEMLNQQNVSEKSINHGFVKLEDMAVNWKSWPTWLRMKHKFCLKITCCLPEPAADRTRLFEAIAKGGLPLVLWSRTSDIPGINISDEMDCFMTLPLLRDLTQLLEVVRQKRAEAFIEDASERYLGHHLGILCDDPTRLPPLEAAPPFESDPLLV